MNITNERAIEVLSRVTLAYEVGKVTVTQEEIRDSLNLAVKAIEQQHIDKSAMMYEIYMEGVNMSGEYQGCWVRFKDIEKIVDKYMAEGDKEWG